MKTRVLGSTGLVVSDIGFGSWQLGNESDWGRMQDSEAHRLVHRAIELGVNLFDTAPNYAASHSERLLGEALHGKRQDVILVSKFGHTVSGGMDFSAERLAKSLDESLQRLQTDYLDVLLLHNPPAEVYSGDHPLWEALEKVKKYGKIRYYGASLDLASEIESCLQNTGSQVLEILFNIFHQDARRAFPLVREQNAGTIIKVPLDSGWLTGKYHAKSEFSGIRSRWSPEQQAQRAALLEEIAWLTSGGSKLSQKAIGYLLAYDEVSCIIPGCRTVEQLESHVATSGRSINKYDRLRLETFWDEFTEGGKNLLPW